MGGLILYISNMSALLASLLINEHASAACAVSYNDHIVDPRNVFCRSITHSPMPTFKLELTESS